MNIETAYSRSNSTNSSVTTTVPFPTFACVDRARQDQKGTGCDDRNAVPEFPLSCSRISTPVVDLLEKAAVQPDAPLIMWNEYEFTDPQNLRMQSWSYAEFAGAARGCANFLHEKGIIQGDRVAIICKNSAVRQAWQFGIWWLGAAEVAVNFELTGDLLATVLQDSDPKLIVLDNEFRSGVVEASPDSYAGLEDQAFVDTFSDYPGFLSTNGDDVEAATYLDGIAREVKPGDMCSLIYTSGTTGPAKGVMLPAGYTVGHGHSIAHVAGLTKNDVGYFVTPFFHVDFHVVFSAIILSGGSVAIRPKFTASGFWEETKYYGATWTWVVGFLFSAIREQGVEASEGHSISRIIGAPIPEGTYEHFEDQLGINILTLYGQTEADGPLYDTRERRGRGGAGWASVGFEVQIHDESGEQVPTDTPGELVYRPQFPHMIMLGYWKRPDSTVEAWQNLWMRSGDRAQMDIDGFVYFLGRKSDSIRRRGENISAYELETLLKKAPGVEECAVVGVSDEFSGEEEIKVFVVPVRSDSPTYATDAAFSLASFEQYCRNQVPRYATPKYLQFTDHESLVRSPGTQVIQKHRLLQLQEEQERLTNQKPTVYTLNI